MKSHSISKVLLKILHECENRLSDIEHLNAKSLKKNVLDWLAERRPRRRVHQKHQWVSQL